jgi:hypothetical protein
MRNLILAGFLAMAVGSSGCVVRMHSAPGPRPVTYQPVPAPAPAPVVVRQGMTQDEAIYMGSDYCRGRGFNCGLKEVHQTGNGIWKVKFEVARADTRGHLHLEYDAYSRALVKADEKVKNHGKHHGHDDDDHGRTHGASAAND